MLCGLEIVVAGICGRDDGDAFHLDEPCRTADGSKSDDAGCRRQTFGKILVDEVVVCHVAQIDDGLHNVVERGSAFFEQGFDIFEHTGSLCLDVAEIDHFAAIVDACRAADDQVTAVAVLDSRAAFEGYTILIGGIEVGGCIQITLLFRTKTLGGVGIHLHTALRLDGLSANACAGD